MALSSYWVSQNRKDLAERAIVAKREKDALRSQRCLEADTFHRRCALSSAKYRTLEETQVARTPRLNEESSVLEKQEAEKKEGLENRRRKLARLLELENEQYLRELEEMKKTECVKDPFNIGRIKVQIDDLQRKRKEAELNMLRRNRHNNISSNSTFSKEYQSMDVQQQTEIWKKRKEELDRLGVEKQQKETHKLKLLEQEQLKAMREARQAELEHLDEEEKWTRLMQQKHDDLLDMENSITAAKAQIEILEDRLEVLNSLHEKRNTLRDLQKQGLQKMKALWQPKEKLRRISVEVLHSLETDLKTIKSLLAINECGDGDAHRVKLNLDCVAEMRDKLENYIGREKQRGSEIQQMYQEEASKILDSKQDEWHLESNERDNAFKKLFKDMELEINACIKSATDEERRVRQSKEICRLEIDGINSEMANSMKTLEDKQEYYLVQANSLKDQLHSKISLVTPEPSVSNLPSHPLGFY